MSGATFGRKGTVDGAALAARREAFLAAERARAQRPAQESGVELTRPGPASTPFFVREKSVGTAYLLWFFLGGFSAHRFYLGYTTSAMTQLVLTPLSYGLLFADSLIGLLTLCGAGLWILADAFLIPGMQREANARGRRADPASIFA